MRFFSSQIVNIQRHSIPYFILFISLLLTVGLVFLYRESIVKRDMLRFNNAIQRTRLNITDRMTTYTTLLRSGAGLFAADESLTREQFEAFVERLQIQNNFPGIQGIGYIKRINNNDLASATEQIVLEGFGDSNIDPQELHSEHNIIWYFEPLRQQIKEEIGYDYNNNPALIKAMDKARDSGLPTMSEKTKIIQQSDAKINQGFFILVPVYKSVEIPQTINERKDLLEGFIYSPFQSDNFFHGIITDKEPRVNFKIYDGNEVSNEKLLYDSTKFAKLPSGYAPQYTKKEQVKYNGNTWTILYSSAQGLDAMFESNNIPFLLIVGIISSLFLFYLSRFQHTARLKAEHSEQKLRHSEERYKRLVASTKVLPWEADLVTGDFTYVGAQAKQLLGYPVSEWYKKGFWLKHLHPDDIGIKKKLIKNKSDYEFDYRMVKKNGQTIWIHEIVKVVRRPDGKKVQSGIMIDITERQMLEKQKDDFLSIATHELKTPVTSIKAFA